MFPAPLGHEMVQLGRAVTGVFWTSDGDGPRAILTPNIVAAWKRTDYQILCLVL